MNKPVTVILDGARYRVKVYCLGKKGSRPVLFSNGFIEPPESYHGYLKGLSDKGYYIVAPQVNGFRIQGGKSTGDYPNNSVVSCRRIFHAAAEKVVTGAVAVVGHSTGAAVAQSDRLHYGKTVLINPVMPVDYGVVDFFKRALVLRSHQVSAVEEDAFRHAVGMDRMSHLNQAFFQNLQNNLALVESFSKTRLGTFYLNKDSDALILTGGNDGRDEYFDVKKYVPALKKTFSSLTVKNVKGGHEEVIYNPGFFVKETLRFLKD